MGLKIEQSLGLHVTSQLIQSMEILQMTSQELTAYLFRAAEENPVIDIDALHSMSDAVPLGELISSESRYDRLDDGGDEKSGFDFTAHAANAGETLEEHLLAQLVPLRLKETERLVCRYLIHCVDENGYLDEDTEDLAALFSLESQLVEDCVSILRSMQPPGVCAKDLKSCLLAQLPDDPLSLEVRIIHTYLDSLAAGHYRAIARTMKTSESEVRKAAAIIRGLNPIPSAGFSDKRAPHFVRPDAEIQIHNGTYLIKFSRSFSSTIQICPPYEEMLRTAENPSLQAYLREKIESVYRLKHAVEQRERTFVRCIQIIAEIQKDYFLHGRDLVPMTLMDVAERLDVQPSTVSRAIRGRYIQCAKGLRQMKDLFSSGSQNPQGEVVAYASVQDRVAALIAQEDKTKPLSDQEICELLHEQGVEISRRAVAKYRTELGIPSTYLRKQSN